MKNLIAAVLLMVGVGANAQLTTNSYSFLNLNAAIPDGSPVGLTLQTNVSGLGSLIGNVTVTLDITGGFNGDLYAYLMGPQGQVAVLLNRVGVSGSNPIGYGDAGMNITLDGTATSNIHYYGSIPGYNLVGTVWAADGRNINPQSSGSAFDSAATTSGLNLFNNTDANGAWTLFIADLASGGGSPTLNSAFLTIMTVPEPQTWVMLGGGLGMLMLFRRRNKN